MRRDIQPVSLDVSAEGMQNKEIWIESGDRTVRTLGIDLEITV